MDFRQLYSALPLMLGATLLLTICTTSSAQEYDLVLSGGRVIDPESLTDAIRNVGIHDGQIAVITPDRIVGRETVEVTGLVVAPGFIDLHAHGQNPESSRYQAGDGVTTALELEVGVYPVAPWYASMAGQARINYGATASHLSARVKVKHGIDIGHSATLPLSERAKLARYDAYAKEEATEEEIGAIAELLQQSLDAGALGLGYGLVYTPAANHREIYQTFKVAADNGATCFVHLRANDAFSDNEAIGAVQEVIANAAVTGASLHVVHVNSSGGDQVRVCIDMIRGARERGIDVSTEVYPYTASSTLLQSAIFDGDWEKKSGLQYSDIMWVETGERLNAETFHQYRKIGGWVIIYSMKEETITWLVSQPDVMIASDGIPFVNGKAHPRGAGTFARYLGRYVREQRVMSLIDGLRKITLDPARRLEPIAPQMKRKGRVQVGADADLTVFDPDTILDRATFLAPAQFSAGIAHVIVNGTFVVRDYAFIEDAYPGQPVRGIVR